MKNKVIGKIIKIEASVQYHFILDEIKVSKFGNKYECLLFLDVKTGKIEYILKSTLIKKD